MAVSFQPASPAPRRTTNASLAPRSSVRASWRSCPTPTCIEETTMQVILMDKVVNLGNLGDVVKVKDGYARNFLIPTGRARRATQANMEAFAAQKAELERVAAEKLASAQGRAGKLEGTSVTVRQKAGVDGRLFGSITNADIADALKAQGHEVVKA